MKKSLRVLFFGNERIATGIHSSPVVLQALIDSDHAVVGLMVHSSGTTSRSKTAEPTLELAESRGIPVYNPANLKVVAEQLHALQADIGVLVAYGKIIPQEIIDIFPLGIINLHPSELPKFRGSTPVESVILSGQSQTAVSIMRLVAKMDAGPILAQKSLSIPYRIPKQDLADTLHMEGANLMISVLASIADQTQTETEQSETDVTLCSLIAKSDGMLDWSKPAEQLEREIRAYAGWPTSYFEKNGIRYVVTSADSTDEIVSQSTGTTVTSDKALGIQTGEGTLWIKTIQPAGKKEMPVEAFLNGYRNKLS
jgi:methionyl-tRNA formyltransferase